MLARPSDPRACEYYQSAFKLSPRHGCVSTSSRCNRSLTCARRRRRLRQQRLAQGLLAEASTTVVYRQHAQEVPDTADALRTV